MNLLWFKLAFTDPTKDSWEASQRQVGYLHLWALGLMDGQQFWEAAIQDFNHDRKLLGRYGIAVTCEVEMISSLRLSCFYLEHSTCPDRFNLARSILYQEYRNGSNNYIEHHVFCINTYHIICIFYNIIQSHLTYHIWLVWFRNHTLKKDDVWFQCPFMKKSILWRFMAEWEDWSHMEAILQQDIERLLADGVGRGSSKTCLEVQRKHRGWNFGSKFCPARHM